MRQTIEISFTKLGSGSVFEICMTGNKLLDGKTKIATKVYLPVLVSLLDKKLPNRPL